MNTFICANCGNFIVYTEIEKQKVNIKYIPDSAYSTEEFIYEHKKHILNKNK